MNQARLVIYKSPTGREPWTPIAQHEVPAWVLKPETMGRLVAGEACMDCAEGDSGSAWYKACRVVSPAEKAAQERREKRQAKRRVH